MFIRCATNSPANVRVRVRRGVVPVPIPEPRFRVVIPVPAAVQHGCIRFITPLFYFIMRKTFLFSGEASPVSPLKEVYNKDARQCSRPRTTRRCTRANARAPHSRRHPRSRRRATRCPCLHNNSSRCNKLNRCRLLSW